MTTNFSALSASIRRELAVANLLRSLFAALPFLLFGPLGAYTSPRGISAKRTKMRAGSEPAAKSQGCWKRLHGLIKKVGKQIIILGLRLKELYIVLRYCRSLRFLARIDKDLLIQAPHSY